MKNEDLLQNNETKIQVMSPSMMVFKRFTKNKLAIVGVCILLFVFIYSFIIGLFIPFSSTKVFYTNNECLQEIANISIRKPTNSDNTYYLYSNIKYDQGLYDDLDIILTKITKNNNLKDVNYIAAAKDDNNNYVCYYLNKKNDVFSLKTKNIVLEQSYSLCFDNDNLFDSNNTKINDEKLKKEVSDNISNNLNLLNNFLTYGIIHITNSTYNGYYILKHIGFKKYKLCKINYKNFEMIDNNDKSVGYCNYLIGDLDEKLFTNDENFVFDNFFTAIYEALYNGISNVTYDNLNYNILKDNNIYKITNNLKNEIGIVTNIQIGFDTIYSNVDYFVRNQLRTKITNIDESEKSTSFSINDKIYTLEKTVFGYNVKTRNLVTMTDNYAAPSFKHWLGTDSAGRDVLKRTMDGGRISLMVGVIVMIISVIIATVIGGIAGYFGGFIDNILMRFVDFMMCIPFFPIMLILGALFDSIAMSSLSRIIWMMIVMGLMYWTNLARVIRGQIKSMKEQEYMLAAKAMGIPVRKRIFKHLIPNVMPYIIVNATMGIGDVIITESTLSFFGIGAKYPMATWGAMISSIRGSMNEIMAHWFIWIPIGLLISATVIAFNFVGDGLRDAYDPKARK